MASNRGLTAQAPAYMGGGSVPASNFGGSQGGGMLGSNPWAASLGGGMLGGSLGSLFGGSKWKNPYDKSMSYFEQMKKDLPQYFNPTIEAGQRALPGLEQAYGNMMNPGEFMKKIGSGYQESPGFQFMKNQGMSAANNAAGAGGMLGTPQHQQQSAQMAENLANQDFYNYLDKALGTYGGGVQGLQGLYSGGSQAQMGLGENLAQILASMGGLAGQGQEASNQHGNDFWSSIGGAAGSILPFFLR